MPKLTIIEINLNVYCVHDVKQYKCQKKLERRDVKLKNNVKIALWIKIPRTLKRKLKWIGEGAVNKCKALI